jgi:hypothetical protein
MPVDLAVSDPIFAFDRAIGRHPRRQCDLHVNIVTMRKTKLSFVKHDDLRISSSKRKSIKLRLTSVLNFGLNRPFTA